MRAMRWSSPRRARATRRPRARDGFPLSGQIERAPYAASESWSRRTRQYTACHLSDWWVTGHVTALTEFERDECLKLLRHRLQAVDAFNLVLRLKSTWDQPKPLEIFLEGKPIIQGNSNAFFNPVLEVGVIHCRALLEFLGLYEQNGTLGPNGKRRKPDDVGIENFDLAQLDPITYAAAEEALVAVFHTANKGVAHFTRSLEPKDVTFGVDPDFETTS